MRSGSTRDVKSSRQGSAQKEGGKKTDKGVKGTNRGVILRAGQKKSRVVGGKASRPKKEALKGSEKTSGETDVKN